MMTETVYVPDISCTHCMGTIEREMMALRGMKRVMAELGSKRVTFTYEAPATAATIEAEMKEIGYPPKTALTVLTPLPPRTY